jgi:hypothetical protein
MTRLAMAIQESRDAPAIVVATQVLRFGRQDFGPTVCFSKR